MVKRTLIAGMMLSLVCPSVAFAADAPSGQLARTGAHISTKQGGVSFSLASVGGSGCSEDSVTLEPGPDGASFAVGYRGFSAQGRSSDNCQLTLRAHVPWNVTYAVEEVTSVGGVGLLRPGSLARQTITAYYSGSTATTRVRNDIRGPYANRDWVATNSVPYGQMNWSPCERNSHLFIFKNYLQVRGTPQDYLRLNASLVRLSIRHC